MKSSYFNFISVPVSGLDWEGRESDNTVLSFISMQACENGRGAVLLSVARGKVSEGVDFGKLP